MVGRAHTNTVPWTNEIELEIVIQSKVWKGDRKYSFRRSDNISVNSFTLNFISERIFVWNQKCLVRLVVWNRLLRLLWPFNLLPKLCHGSMNIWLDHWFWARKSSYAPMASGHVSLASKCIAIDWNWNLWIFVSSAIETEVIQIISYWIITSFCCFWNLSVDILIAQ